MNVLSTALGEVPAPAAYPILAAVVLAESLLLIGAFVPTLTLLLTAGALARTGELHLLLVIATATGAVITGDFLAHRTGRLLGPRLRTAGIGRRIPAATWQRAVTLMARHGGRALLITRFIPVIRTLSPHLAGATGQPYHRIAPFSALAAPVWAAAEAGAGYAAVPSLQHALTFGVPAVAALLAAAAGAALWRKNRTGRRPASRSGVAPPSTGSPSGPLPEHDRKSTAGPPPDPVSFSETVLTRNRRGPV
ncbi:DedA family protein [Streptomyces omiyaensis]|uniref:DedA family protein n=1 Tax=Streptomyces omiyaensis TaxID=68247 RepID=UPI0036F61C13